MQQREALCRRPPNLWTCPAPPHTQTPRPESAYSRRSPAGAGKRVTPSVMWRRVRLWHALVSFRCTGGDDRRMHPRPHSAALRGGEASFLALAPMLRRSRFNRHYSTPLPPFSSPLSLNKTRADPPSPRRPCPVHAPPARLGSPLVRRSRETERGPLEARVRRQNETHQSPPPARLHTHGARVRGAHFFPMRPSFPLLFTKIGPSNSPMF